MNIVEISLVLLFICNLIDTQKIKYDVKAEIQKLKNEIEESGEDEK